MIESNQTWPILEGYLYEKKHIKWCTTCIQQPTRTMNSMNEIFAALLLPNNNSQCQYKSDKEIDIKALLWKISGHLLKQNNLKGKLTNIQAYFTCALRSQSLKENSKKGGWEWRVKVYPVREMFNPTMTSLLQSNSCVLMSESRSLRKQKATAFPDVPLWAYLRWMLNWICGK